MSEFIRRETGKPFKARDGADIYELFSPETSDIRNMSIASGSLEPKQEALEHYHKKSEEVYYILSGSGSVRVGDSEGEIKTGDAVHIPIGAAHALENIGEDKLHILAIMSPAYQEEDTFFLIDEQ